MRESFTSFSAPWKTITANYSQFNKIVDSVTVYDLPEDKFEVEVADAEARALKDKGLNEDGLHFEHMTPYTPDADEVNKQVCYTLERLALLL